jgi:hypothetical protein
MKIIISQYCYRFKHFGLEVIMYPCQSFLTRHYGVCVLVVWPATTTYFLQFRMDCGKYVADDYYGILSNRIAKFVFRFYK